MMWFFVVALNVVTIWLSVKISKAVAVAVARKEVSRAIKKFDRSFPVLHVVDDTKKKQEDNLPKFGGF